MKKLMMGVAGVAIVASASHAQAPFADVPRDHWAYDAVNTLSQRGLIIGYPDGTFGGKRAMTRYEFAVVIARMIPQLEEYIRTQVANNKGGATPDLSNYVTKDQLAGYVTRSDFDALQRLVNEFGPELQMLQVDVAGLRRDLNDLKGRVAVVEEEVGRVQIHGDMSVISRHSSTTNSTLHNTAIYGANAGNGAFTGAPTDLDGRPLNRNDNLLEATQILYDTNLGITAKVSQGITANALVNIGNYLGGFASAPTFAGSPFAFNQNSFPYGNTSNGSLSAEITPYKAYIEAPVTFKPLGLLSLQAGKTGVQFTPYTLKLVDYDSYTNLTETDNGDVIFTGLKGNFRIGGIGFTAYGGTHGSALVGGGQDAGSANTNGSGFPVIFGGGVYSPSIAFSNDNTGTPIGTVPELLFGARTNETGTLSGLPLIAIPVTQSAGFHATLGTPFGGTLGLTYLNGGVNNFDNSGGGATPGLNNINVGRAQVYGADLALNLSKGIGVNAEYSNSNAFEAGRKFNFNNDNSLFSRKLHQAYDARVAFGLSKIALTAGYKRVDPLFAAPGSWGSIGRWKNPTNIKGYIGTIGIPLAKSLSLAGSAEGYRSIVAGVGATDADVLSNDDSTKITRYTAGLKFALTSANRVDLGVEVVNTRPNALINGDGIGSGNDDNTAQETFYNIGYGTNLSSSSSFKLLYQIIDYKDKGANFLNNGQDAKGSVAVGQFTVKF